MLGGKEAFQGRFFTNAWNNSKLGKTAEIETKFNSDIRAEGWGASDAIEWLKEDADIYFILCHLHQGVKNPRWDCSELIISFRSLENRIGFPLAENLRCPMFTQNKWNGLSAVKERINFTLPIGLQNLEMYMPHLDKILIDHYLAIYLSVNTLTKLYELSKQNLIVMRDGF